MISVPGYGNAVLSVPKHNDESTLLDDSDEEHGSKQTQQQGTGSRTRANHLRFFILVIPARTWWEKSKEMAGGGVVIQSSLIS